MWSHDGEHEITLALVHDIEADRFRGRHFDKISVHEAVELTHRIHIYIQTCVARTSRALYGSLGFRGVEASHIVFDGAENLFLPPGFVDEVSRRQRDSLIYGRYEFLGEWIST